jgi:hypothetical protein
MLFGFNIGRAGADAAGPQARAGDDRQARLINRIKKLSSPSDATPTARDQFGLNISDKVPDGD